MAGRGERFERATPVGVRKVPIAEDDGETPHVEQSESLGAIGRESEVPALTHGDRAQVRAIRVTGRYGEHRDTRRRQGWFVQDPVDCALPSRHWNLSTNAARLVVEDCPLRLVVIAGAGICNLGGCKIQLRLTQLDDGAEPEIVAVLCEV